MNAVRDVSFRCGAGAAGALSRYLPAATVVCTVCLRGFAGGRSAGGGRVVGGLSFQCLQELILDLSTANVVYYDSVVVFASEALPRL